MNPLLLRIIGRNDATPALESARHDIDEVSEALHEAAVMNGRYGAAAESAGMIAQSSAMKSRQLMYQMVDIGQSVPLLLQSPVYGLQNLGFQVAQIGQLYYGQGGMGAALKDMGSMMGGAVARVAPLAVALGGLAVVAMGARSEIEEMTGTAVGLGDMAAAAWEMMSDRIAGALGTTIDVINGFFAGLWESVEGFARDEFNAIAGALDQVVAQVTAGAAIVAATWDAAKGRIQVVWEQLPAALGDITIGVAQAVLDGTEYMINGAIGLLNDFTRGARGALEAIGVQLGDIGDVEFGNVPNSWAGASAGMGAAMDAIAANQWDAINAAMATYNSEMERIVATDYFGDFAQRAADIALARGELEEVAGAASAANDNAGRLGDALADAAKRAQEEFDFLRTTFSGFVNEFVGGLREGEGIWESFGSAGVNALNAIADRYLGMAADGFFNMLFGGLLGGGFTAPGGFVPGGYFPAFPGFALGTPSAPGGWSWVGERGPELMNVPRGSQIVPHQASMAMARNGNGRNDNSRGGDRSIKVDVGVTVDESGNLQAYVKSVSEGTAKSISAATVANYDRNTLPKRVDRLNAHKRIGR